MNGVERSSASSSCSRIWGVVALVLRGGTGAVVVGLVVALAVCFWLSWRLTNGYYR